MCLLLVQTEGTRFSMQTDDECFEHSKPSWDTVPWRSA